MGTFADHIPDHRTVERIEGAPAYFLRIYDTTGIPEVQGHVYTPQFHNLHIYGFHARSRYAEDRSVDDGVWHDRRAFPAWCFSTVTPEGEPGYVPLSAVREITIEEFEAAHARGWEP